MRFLSRAPGQANRAVYRRRRNIEREVDFNTVMKSPTPPDLITKVASPSAIQLTSRKAVNLSKLPATAPAFSDESTTGINRVSSGFVDFVWLVLLVSSWAGCFASAFLAARDGCPSNCNSFTRLAYGYDSQGRQCGFGHLADYPYVHIASPSHPLTSRICLPKCPSVSLSVPTSLSLPLSMRLCVGAAAIYDPAPSDPRIPFCLSSSVSCCYVSYPTVPFSRRCLPSISAAAAAAVNSSVASVIFGSSSSLKAAVAFASNPQGSTSAILQQIGSNLPLLPAAAVSATAMSLLFCLILRRAAALTAVIILFLIFAFLSALSLGLWTQSTLLPQLPLPMPSVSILSLESLPLTPLQCAAATVISFAFTVAFAAFSISILRRIFPAVAVIQLAAKVLWSAPRIVAVTACGGIIAAVCVSSGLILLVMLASAGGFDPMTMTFINSDSDEMRSCVDLVSAAVSPASYPKIAVLRACSFYSGDATLAVSSLPTLNSTANINSSTDDSLISVRAFQYMMFGSAASVFWTVLWVGAVTTCITAATVAQWYWQGGGVGVAVVQAVREVLRHRLGSCALSSLTLAMFLPFLAVLRLIANAFSRLSLCVDRSCRQKNAGSSLKGSNCCDSSSRSCASVASLLSSNAVIACSTMQLPLFSAARRAHSLLRCHASQLVVVGATAGAVMSCGRICVALLTAISSIAFYYFRTFYDDAMPSWIIVNTTAGFPVATIASCATIAYIVAAAVFGALSITVDTLFLCVCDELQSPRERVIMHRRLAALLQLHQNDAPKAAESKSPIPGQILSPSKASKYL